ncbi:MAG: Fic family protein [Chitinophagaceae bacterium]|nr:Fic family protein [Chitinophagaceae bacterium]
MPTKPAGAQWLKEHFKLDRFSLTHSSYIGNNDSIELTSRGNIEQVYGPRYAPRADSPLNHLVFMAKYDDINLDFLKSVFDRIENAEMETAINAESKTKYLRKIGFLYEFLTGKIINLEKPVSANYTELLKPGNYLTGLPGNDQKWKIKNNLLGDQNYCPVVRRTKLLNSLLESDTRVKIDQLKKTYPTEIFQRATNYLYNKETKSSYEIEKEIPSPDRMQTFVSLLMKGGSEANETFLGKDRLTHLQNAIVDPRFAAKDFRDFQNYVGESLPNGHDLIHYICPPPQMVSSLMDGLRHTAIRSLGTFPEARAAILAFGFVFIHPFEDGNGRLHRFLIHDILVHDNLVPSGLIIPVSAHMLNNIKEYDNVLEKYSKPLMQRIKYTKQDIGEITVTNPSEVEGYFKYPDLTDQCIYLIQTIHATLEDDMPGELIFLQRYDEAKKELQRIVDMPDKLINLMLIFLHQNQGKFPKRRREQFSLLTDEEIACMEEAYNKVFTPGQFSG